MSSDLQSKMVGKIWDSVQAGGLGLEDTLKGWSHGLSIAHIDETAQSIIGKSSSIFDITKGKEDKRVKVIRVKDDEVFQYWWIKKASKKKL